MKINTIFLSFLFFFFLSCKSSSKKSKITEVNDVQDVSNVKSVDDITNINTIDLDKSVFKISHSINTSTSEYYPVITKDGKSLFFTGMDRSGFFDYKIDFTKTRNNGGEDIFYSSNYNGTWDDSRDFKMLTQR